MSHVEQHTLIPALDGPAVIVLDNAPYHNTKTAGSYFPTRNTIKAEIKRWLEEKGVAVDDDETKVSQKYKRGGSFRLTVG